MRNDGEIVQSILAGRPERFAELVDRHAPAVFRLLRAAISHRQDAEDLGQEVFLAAYRSLARLKDPDRFRAYLMRIASRRIIDRLRRKKRRPDALPLEDEPAIENSELRATVRAVEEVVATLPAPARLMFALRHHEGLSCKQIARLLNRPAGTIHSQLFRTHAAIRSALEVKE
ncbi:MAG: RNA polymerase sigma factor [Planctomycetota bacterium]